MNRAEHASFCAGSNAAQVARPSWWRSSARLHGAVWLAALLLGCSPEAPDVDGQLARGEELYEANCAVCHGGATGGEISDIPPPHNAEGHTWHHPDCELKRIVLDGMPARPGLPTMPPFSDTLDEDDVEAILAYLKTWWEPDQRSFQQEVTAQACN